jgi:hypothetical protein
MIRYLDNMKARENRRAACLTLALKESEIAELTHLKQAMNQIELHSEKRAKSLDSSIKELKRIRYRLENIRMVVD